MCHIYINVVVKLIVGEYFVVVQLYGTKNSTVEFSKCNIANNFVKKNTGGAMYFDVSARLP